MRVDVMQHYGFTQPLTKAGYYETRHHRQLMLDIKSAILQGHLLALCGVIGSGKTVTLRRLHQQLKEEKRVLVSTSLAVDKQRITLGTLITALCYDLSTEKPIRIPTQSEKRERELQELVKKGKRPVVLCVDEAHNLTRQTLTDLKRLLEVVEDSDGTLSIVLAGHPKLGND
jgi:type II secretory pathway predicted ATPase ExeA